jgi:hypothetical protein
MENQELITAAEYAASRADTLEEKARAALEAVRTYPPIDAQAIAELYAAEMLDIKTRINEIELDRLDVVGPFNEGVRRINARYKKARTPLEMIEQILKQHIGKWQTQQRLEADAKQRALDTAARVERERLRAEAAAQQAKAAEQVAAGNPHVARELAAQATATQARAAGVMTEIVPEPPALDGVSVRTVWKANIEDKALLLEYCGQHAAEFADAVEFKQSWFDAQAARLKGKLDLPGVVAVEVPIVAGRTK